MTSSPALKELADGYVERRFGASSLESRQIEAAEPRFRFLSETELEQRDDPVWLLEGMLPEAGFVVLVGTPASGKTFTALDLAVSIGTGTPWFGRQTQKGQVVFVLAEGVGGMKARLLAQKSARGLTRTGIVFYPTAIPLMNNVEIAAWSDELTDYLGGPPALVIPDTWPRCVAPGDENSAMDVGVAIKSVDIIRERTGAAVLVLHHPPRGGEAPRGSGALEGAADAVWALRQEEGLRILECRKMKDAAPFEPIRYRLVSAGVSCVLGPEDAIPEGPSITQSQLRVLDALRQIDVGTGVLSTDLQEASALPRGSYFRVRKQLIKHKPGLIEEVKHRLRLTEAGENALQVSRSHRSLTTVA